MILRFLPALAICFCLLACRLPGGKAEAPTLAETVDWSGHSAIRIRDSVSADTTAPGSCLGVEWLGFPGSEPPFRLEMRKYRTDYFAFAALESLDPARFSAGDLLRTGKGWAFCHGPYLGLTDSVALNLGREELKARLRIGGEAPVALPREFEAFPLLGRVPGSERVWLRDFLGGPWRGPVFSVAYRCSGDTAIAFRGLPQKEADLEDYLSLWKGHRDRGKNRNSWRFEGVDEFGRPMLFRFSPKGILGFSGCYDSVQGQEYLEKMEKTGVFWNNP